MSFENPQDNDIQVLVATEVTAIMQSIGSTIGSEIGSLQSQLNAITSLDLASLTQLQTNVQALYTALDGDPQSPGFQNLQNLLALIDRVVALEAHREAVDTSIAALTQSVQDHEARIASLEANGTGDLAVLESDVQALKDQVIELQSVDAGQATQIQGLLNRLDGLDTLLAGMAQQLADLSVGVTQASGTAQAALTAAQANAAAIANLDSRESNNNTNNGNKHQQLRRQVYGAHVNLATVAISAFAGSFAAAKLAAMP
jgi:chromosome segregation ATPase